MSDTRQLELPGLTDSETNSLFANAEQLWNLLDQWMQARWIRSLELSFARMLYEVLMEQEPQEQPCTTTLFMAVLVSHQVGRGHVCIELEGLLNEPNTLLGLPPADPVWVDYALQERAPLAPGQLFVSSHMTKRRLIQILQNSALVSDGEQVTPLVLDRDRLYLRRNWLDECSVACAITQRLATRAGLEAPTTPMAKRLQTSLTALFERVEGIDYQQVACALAARTQFSVITGGPGTGKTTTVVRLLAALQSMAADDPQLQRQGYRIELAAPTGKAAARLKVAIGDAIDRLSLESLGQGVSSSDIPRQVTTVHRLLGSKPGSRAFRHNRHNPLQLDLLVVDEASMIDLRLLASLVEALPQHAQLILIGDKDQLASVEAGAVLGELCSTAEQGHYRSGSLEWIAEITGMKLPGELADEKGRELDQCIAMLRRSYRFAEESGIQKLAEAVNHNRGLDQLLSQFSNGEYADLNWITPDRPEQPANPMQSMELPKLISLALSGFKPYLERLSGAQAEQSADRRVWDRIAADVLESFNHFQLLCAVRQGFWGVEAVNQSVAEALYSAGLIDRSEGWYAGRPVMISRNDYALDLWNGDLGITFKVPWGTDGEPVMRVAFAATDEQGRAIIRWVAPSRLPEHETVFAMTVHKSQGSEFGHCCLVLPDRQSALVTRELIYTAVTRAKQAFTLYSTRDAILQGVGRRTLRASGLALRMR